MPMIGDPKYAGPRVTQNNTVRLTGWFTVTGGAGAIAVQAVTATANSGPHQCGVTVTRNAAGDYRLALHRGYRRCIRAAASFIAPILATAPTPAITANMANATNGNFTGTTVVATGAFGIQCLDAAGALADPQDLATITYDIELADT